MPLLGAFVNGVFGRRLGKQAVAHDGALGSGVIARRRRRDLLRSATSRTRGRGGGHEGHERGRPCVAKLSRLAWSGCARQPARQPHHPDRPLSSASTRSPASRCSSSRALDSSSTSTRPSYMVEDKAYWRFFTHLNLFHLSMPSLIPGDSLPVLFVGWKASALQLPAHRLLVRSSCRTRPPVRRRSSRTASATSHRRHVPLAVYCWRARLARHRGNAHDLARAAIAPARSTSGRSAAVASKTS